MEFASYMVLHVQLCATFLKFKKSKNEIICGLCAFHSYESLLLIFKEQYQFLYDTIARTYPAQNGQIKNIHQEDKVEFCNEVEKKDQESDLITIDLTPSTPEENDAPECCDDFKAADTNKGTESSTNGPTTPVLT